MTGLGFIHLPQSTYRRLILSNIRYDFSNSNAHRQSQYANFSSGYLNSGAGSIKFRLVNMHSDYMFVFFINGTDYPIAVGSSNTINFENEDEPLQGHLALTADPNSMR
jgi:hypothetical protein